MIEECKNTFLYAIFLTGLEYKIKLTIVRSPSFALLYFIIDPKPLFMACDQLKVVFDNVFIYFVMPVKNKL